MVESRPASALLLMLHPNNGGEKLVHYHTGLTELHLPDIHALMLDSEKVLLIILSSQN